MLSGGSRNLTGHPGREGGGEGGASGKAANQKKKEKKKLLNVFNRRQCNGSDAKPNLIFLRRTAASE